MRGKDSSSGFHNVHLRITPAYAGKSYCACLWLDDIEDHPRLCGEKLPAAPSLPAAPGITPAYAGKRTGR